MIDRRLCVRITGIPSQKNESAEGVRNSVKSIIKNLEVIYQKLYWTAHTELAKTIPQEKMQFQSLQN